jgi:hypothetical protein
MAVTPHSPYSPDMAPCDYFLFPRMKLKLKGRLFDKIEEIQAESLRVLDNLTEKNFQEAFQKLRRWRGRCIHAGGNYFEVNVGLMVSFMIFTASVRNILDTPAYVPLDVTLRDFLSPLIDQQ